MTSHSYYVVMVDYGSNYPGKKGPSGLEAVVQPEKTRRAIIEELAHGEYKHVAFIHHVDGLYIEDVSSELFDEAEALCRTGARGWERFVSDYGVDPLTIRAAE